MALASVPCETVALAVAAVGGVVGEMAGVAEEVEVLVDVVVAAAVVVGAAAAEEEFAVVVAGEEY